jgi:alanyl-tRNA synthetase
MKNSFKNISQFNYFGLDSDFMVINSVELREKYQSFFEKKGHKRIASASLIPENDPTVLFTTAGMHPLVPYLMGETHPLGKRIVNVQKCIRTGDIDEVGDKWHLSFFEMMGHWSFGDYFKKEAIEMTYEFLTKELGLDKDRISVTVFEGDNDAPRDNEVAKAWESVGIPKNRIHFLPKTENWWGPAGVTGPCGPDTECFYRMVGDEEKDTADFVERDQDFPEMGNDVLMQYNKTVDGRFEESKQKNIDNGTGVERILCVLNGYENAFECDTLKPIYEKVKELAKVDTNNKDAIKSLRIITDHLRAAVMILGDDKAVSPSNVDQGYILRRFIRRSIRHSRLLGIKNNFCKSVAEVVVETMKFPYEEIEKNKEFIFCELEKEEEKFSVALEKGTKILENKLFFLGKASENVKDKVKKELNGKGAFDLFQSYGFPLEMTIEMCAEKGFTVDTKKFEELIKEHQEKSRKGAKQKFKGGLADAKEETTKLHTVTHLVLAALKEIVSSEIEQKGANINAERIRFDFNSEERLTDEQIKKVEEWVNKVIREEAEVKVELLSLKDAKEAGAHGTFDSKYGEKVKVYTVFKNNKVFSKEICGGPHVKTTKGMGVFKIIKQGAVAAGIKRIKAILE